jgi:hypothetical protein
MSHPATTSDRRVSDCRLSWLLGSTLAAMLCLSCGKTTPAPTSPSTSTDVSIAGDVTQVDAATHRLYLQALDDYTMWVTLTPQTVISGDAASFDDIAELSRVGFRLLVTGRGPGVFASSATANELHVAKSGPFRSRRAVVYTTLGTWGLVTTAFRYERQTLQIPPEAVLEPDSPVKSLADAQALMQSRQWVCVTADRFEVGLGNGRAVSYSMQPTDGTGDCPR